MADLHEIKPEPIGEDVIKTIETMLERAKAGELSSVAIAYVERDGSTGHLASDMPHWAAQIGSIYLMLHRIIG